MQAVMVTPGTAGSARLDDVAELGAELGTVVVEALAVGICGTDAEIAGGAYGWPPPGEERLILGHESLGRVLDPGPTGLAVAEHVVGIVRRPDPLPCPNCAVGEWDMCSNGPDIVVECTGVLTLIQQPTDAAAPGGIVCLTGIGPPSATTAASASTLATDAVLKNLVLFGSVNANRRHYYRAAKVLARADRSWLEQLVTRRARPDDVEEALTRQPDDIKVVMEFATP